MAVTVYDQQRKQHNNRDAQSPRLIGHTGRVCAFLIPSGHSGETSQDDSLNKAYISCPAFRGKGSNGIHKLFRDILREIYDKIFDIDAEPLPIPEDYYTAIANATEAVGEEHTSMMDDYDLLHLFEYYKITKVSGVNSPYACAEWPGIQIPKGYPEFSGPQRNSIYFLQRQESRRGIHFTIPRAQPSGTRSRLRRLPRDQT